VNVASGQQASIILAVTPATTGEGEGEDEGEGEGDGGGNGGCGCTESKNAEGQIAGWSERPGDVLVLCILLAVLAYDRKRRIAA